jgi:monoamine oxidase
MDAEATILNLRRASARERMARIRAKKKEARHVADMIRERKAIRRASPATRKDFKMAGQPVDKVLFFAGEHTNPDYRGSVHGAYLSGIRAAKEVWDHDE